MLQSIRVFVLSLTERIRSGGGRRAAGIVLALLLEGLLALLLLTLAPSTPRQDEDEVTVFSLDPQPDTVPEPEQPPTPPEPDARAPQPAERPASPPPEPSEAPPPPPVEPPTSSPPPLIQLSREQMAAADIATLPAPPAAPAPKRPAMGPPDTGTPRDTARVDGAGPNGEPLYAAAWYREPYDDELRGYLSTARGPGWGLIACRTVRDYRVEDCVAVGEYPERSNIARSVLAAAWQFRVRPPRIGGRPMVGEWVRIRIDYEQRRQ